MKSLDLKTIFANQTFLNDYIRNDDFFAESFIWKFGIADPESNKTNYEDILIDEGNSPNQNVTKAQRIYCIPS